MAIVRRGPLVEDRVVKLSCGHEQNHKFKQVGELLGCLTCTQRIVLRSKLNSHTKAQMRRVVSVTEGHLG